MLIFLNIPLDTISTAQDNSSTFFSFDSSLSLLYDSSGLNTTLELGNPITVPLDISYSTEIPSNFLRFFPKAIKNYILFKNTAIPEQTITLSIIESPGWINITFENKTLKKTMPEPGNQITMNTSFQVTPQNIPSPGSYEIIIRASSTAVGRINSFSKQFKVQFTPSFLPRAIIKPTDENVIKLSFTNNTKTSFQITSKANTLTRIEPFIEKMPENISISFYPKMQDVYWQETATFYMEFIPETGFKHNKSINVSATLQSYPLNGTSMGLENAIVYYLEPPKEKDDGFFINPYLILIIILLAIIIILFWHGKRKECW